MAHKRIRLPEEDRVRPQKKKRKRGFSDKLVRLQDIFQPLINLIREVQLEGNYLQADEKAGQPTKADVALSKIRRLYAIEKSIKDLSRG